MGAIGMSRWTPGRAGAVLLSALVLAYLLGAAGLQAVFAAKARLGRVCRASPVTFALGETASPPAFVDLRHMCNVTGLSVQAGDTLRVTLWVPPAGRWWDRTIPTGPFGPECAMAAADTAALALGLPLRRHLTEPWLQPMLRVGGRGAEVHALLPDDPAARPVPRTDRCAMAGPAPMPSWPPERPCPPPQPGDDLVTSTVTAGTTGELYLYVNDALGAPHVSRPFYDNNRGWACVTVQRAPAPRS